MLKGEKMAQVIIEMDMPTGCHDCKLFKLNGNCPIPNFKHGLFDKEYTVFRERFERPPWCPIKQEIVPCEECKYGERAKAGACLYDATICISGKRKEE